MIEQAKLIEHLRNAEMMAFPRNVMGCKPTYFTVIDEKNPFMRGQSINGKKASRQWERLFSIYEELKQQGILDAVQILDGEQGREDMVFAANQTFPWLSGSGQKVVLPSQMVHESRQKEVPFYTQFFKQHGYSVLDSIPNFVYEGMGDLIPMPGKRVLFGGYGYRTDKAVFPLVSASLQTPIIPLKLVSPYFYHLDTCFIPINETSVMVVEEAFDPESLQLIRDLFPNVICIPVEEAKNFALNAHIVHNSSKERYAILQKGNPRTVSILSELCETVFEVQTAEFIKSGGSVFCMKMMYF